MPGPAARPALAVVREGNPSHRPVPESVVLPPADDFPDARAWFDQQPTNVQTQIMGAERLARLRSGDLDWGRLAVRRPNPDWRPSYAVRPLARQR